MSAIPYDDWVVLLGDWFLRNDPGEPFVMYVDATVLSEITGVGASAARSGLVEAVKHEGGGISGVDFLRDVNRRVLHWIYKDRRASGYPPYLPVLALSVVVASEMTDTNYYLPFRRALDLRSYDAGMPRRFDDRVANWWSDLISWLNESDDGGLDGALGILISRPNPAWPYVGHARAQAVWKQSDALRLLPAVREIGSLEVVTDAQILEAVQAFARRNRSRLSPRAFRTIFDPEYAEVVAASIRQFEFGEVERAQRVRQVRMKRATDSAAASLWITRHPATKGHELRLTARRPVSWPDELSTADPFGRDVPVTTDADDASRYRIPVLLTHRELSLGTVLEGARHQIRFGELPLYLLAKEERRAGWGQADEIVPGEPFGILLPSSESDALRVWAAQSYGVGGSLIHEHFEGWDLYLGLVVSGAEGLPKVVATALGETHRDALELVGGLRASRSPRTFLTGEAPDVRGRGVRRDQVSAVATINGREVRVPTRDGRLALRDVLSGLGSFEIQHGGAATDVTLTDDGDAPPGKPWPDRRTISRRLFIRRSARGQARFCAFGDAGQVHEFEEPDGTWMADLANHAGGLPFEVQLPFQARWLVQLGARPRVGKPPGDHVEAQPRSGQPTRLALTGWARAVLRIDEDPEVPVELRGEWSQYVVEARGVWG
jgi:hypothetical protein